MMDRSPALSAGSLVVLAQAPGPLPIPVEVEGVKIADEGMVFYQFVLPVDRTEADAAATQPSE